MTINKIFVAGNHQSSISLVIEGIWMLLLQVESIGQLTFSPFRIDREVSSCSSVVIFIPILLVLHHLLRAQLVSLPVALEIVYDHCGQSDSE